MNTTDTIIIGEGFYGLFVGIKIAEKGYNVKIFEKKTKSLFINNLRLFFPENCTYIKKFLNKLNIAYTTIHNNNTTVSLFQILIKCLHHYNKILFLKILVIIS